MDDDFFSDDETFEVFGERELATLEHAALESTQVAQAPPGQPPKATTSYRWSPSSHGGGGMKGSRNVSRASTTTLQGTSGRPTPTYIPQPQDQQQQQVQQSRWQNNPDTKPSPYGSHSGSPQLLVKLGPPWNQIQKQQQGHGQEAFATLAEYNRFGQPIELWDATARVLSQHGDGGDEQQYHHQRQGNLSQVAKSKNEEMYDENDYTNGDLDQILRTATGMEMPVEDGASVFDAHAGIAGYHQNFETLQLQHLQGKVSDLEFKLAQLQSTLETTESMVLAKAGDVSVVVAKLQNRNGNMNSTSEVEQLRTRIMFLNNDYEEAVRKNKVLEKSATVTTNTTTFGGFVGGERGGTASLSMTLKKKKIMTHRDGFDDDEIMIGSPRGGRAKMITAATPSKKRKRITIDSPMNAVLPLSQARRTPTVEGNAGGLHLVDEEILKALRKEDERFDVVYEAIVSHCPEISNVCTLEELSKYSFPSNPAMTLSSMLTDNLSKLNAESLKEEIPVLLKWTPFPHLLDLLQFSFMYSHGGACTCILDDAVDLLQRTIDINAIPIFKREIDKLVPEIDVGRCLTVLEFIALNLLAEEQYARRSFWKLIRIDFV
ncbi:hypothetical protein BDZ91DRAFT_800548 [Kalaharituber pfeilii]|nr:hypothetical protein BDZ91DRAFT_800548 [Kalaharituber pfeilii]